MSRTLIAALILLTLAACAAAPPEPAEIVLGPAELSRSGGCGDVFVYATSADDSLALTINWAEAASRAQAAGGFEERVSLPAPEVTVMLQSGRFLADGFCTDVMLPDRPQVLGEVPASSGEVELSVMPEEGGEAFMPLGRATILLTDVTFEVPLNDGGVETWRIESLELHDIQVGWFAG